jgi:hypothetical protein
MSLVARAFAALAVCLAVWRPAAGARPMTIQDRLFTRVLGLPARASIEGAVR